MPQEVTTIDTIDLSRHAVIEASAGTGKTYTIENLVVRILVEEQIPLEQILLVTYTEKATGELQSRIRANIAKALQSDEFRDNPHLRQALDTFDNAAIHTIHGFCQRLLRQYAFENSESFEHDVVDDGPIYASMLHEIMRRDWPRRYGESLSDLLALANYPGSTFGGSSWEGDVISLCQAYRPTCGDRILPEIPDNALEEALSRLHQHLETLVKLLGPIDSQGLYKSAFYTLYEGLPANQKSQPKILSLVVIPVLKLALSHLNGRADLDAFAQCMSTCNSYKTFKEKGFEYLLTSLNKAAENEEHAPARERLEAVVACLSSLVESVHVDALSALLQVQTVHDLREQVRRYKRQHGYISYDDMLHLVHKALDPQRNPRAPQLATALRKRWRFALVDEFQDTDPIQWAIFRAIFLGSPEHRLMLIGDPKQAIYSFRGADLHTYQKACRQLIDAHGATRYTLPVNYRSRPELIDACNTIFSSATWFTEEGKIGFLPVRPRSIAPEQEPRDSTERPALVRVHIPEALAGKAAPQAFARFIASEIKAMLASPEAIQIWDKTENCLRPIRADDICLLVCTRSEVMVYERELAHAHIPVTHYKKSGLYQSDECLHLLHLLGALAAPHETQAFRKALLTRWFQITPAELPAYDALPADHPIRTTLDAWTQLAGDRDWAPLFRRILHDTALLCDDIRADDGERRVTNYRHLLQELTLIADERHLDIGGLVDYLSSLRHNLQQAENDSDLHRLETERPKVTVMTLHASKGLEYPIVFVVGGQGGKSGRSKSYYTYHDEHDNRCYDLAKTPESKALAEQEGEAELRRLFYVGLTRASHRLYLPWPEKPNKGPVGSFLRHALEADNLPDHVPVDEPLQAPDTTQAQPTHDDAYAPLPEPLLPPSPPALWNRRLRVESFTSLHTHPADAPGGDDSAFSRTLDAWQHAYDHPSVRLDDETAGAESEGAAPERLPPGTRTGSLLHDILERIDYAAVAAAGQPADLLADGSPTRACIDNALEQYQMLVELAPAAAQARKAEVARLVFTTLRTPLPPDGLRLCDLPAADRRHELEFYYPGPLTGAEKLPEVQRLDDGYIHGYIDLVFRHGGRACILDWKSNLLADGYARPHLERAMRDAHYDLQHKLYRVALERWLGDQPNYRFGGVYYLFLRGMNGTTPETGVYYQAGEGT